MADVESERTIWLPSMGGVIFLALLAGLTVGPLAPLLLRDGDALWHIRNGQHILATGQIPYQDWFSASRFGQPWIAWEWLWDVGVGALAHFGLNGPVWLSAVLVATTFALLFRALLRRSMSPAWSLALTLLALAAAAIHLLARPHLVSWLLVLVFWLVLEGAAASPGGARKLWWLVPLTALWANLHPGFVLGLGLIAAFLALALWRRLSAGGGPGPAAGRLAAVLAASVAASLINPYGWNLHLHLLQYVTNPFFLHHVNEMQPPSWSDFSARCLAVLVGIAIAGVVRRWRGLRAETVAPVLIGVGLGLAASRNLPVAGMLVALGAASGLRREVDAGRFHRLAVQELASRGVTWPVAGALVVFGLVLSGAGSGARRLMDVQVDGFRFPVAASEFIVRQRIPAPVFLPDQWSGVLVYAGGYESGATPRVWMDDRHDFYGNGVLAQYLTISNMHKHWEEALEGSGVRAMLLPVGSELSEILIKRAEWKEVYRDAVGVVLVKVADSHSFEELAVH